MQDELVLGCMPEAAPNVMYERMQRRRKNLETIAGHLARHAAMEPRLADQFHNMTANVPTTRSPGFVK